MPGTLFICPTPLGNLEDITIRTLRHLKEVDLIAAESTSHTQKLLHHFDIHKPMISYYDSGKPDEKEEKLIEKLRSGLSVALVSSAGMPLISDPGFRLVRKCLDEAIPVVPLPGPSAVISALVASGLPPHPFYFGGFLPVKSNARRTTLNAVSSLPCTLVFYEAPHRIAESLSDAVEILGDRPAALARELTKIHEEILRGSLSYLLETLKEKKVKGEISLVMGGAINAVEIDLETLEKEIQELLQKGVSVSDASRQLAKKYDIPKNKIYALAHHSIRSIR